MQGGCRAGRCAWPISSRGPRLLQSPPAGRPRCTLTSAGCSEHRLDGTWGPVPERERRCPPPGSHSLLGAQRVVTWRLLQTKAPSALGRWGHRPRSPCGGGCASHQPGPGRPHPPGSDTRKEAVEAGSTDSSFSFRPATGGIFEGYLLLLLSSQRSRVPLSPGGPLPGGTGPSHFLQQCSWSLKKTLLTGSPL